MTIVATVIIVITITTIQTTITITITNVITITITIIIVISMRMLRVERGGQPVLGASVRADITGPAGKLQHLQLEVNLMMMMMLMIIMMMMMIMIIINAAVIMIMTMMIMVVDANVTVIFMLTCERGGASILQLECDDHMPNGNNQYVLFVTIWHMVIIVQHLEEHSN